MSYQTTKSTERRVGRVRFFHGATRVGVVFFDGKAVALPAEPFQKVGLSVGDSFAMLVTRDAGKVTNVVISPLAPARVPLQDLGRTTPKVYDRVGRGLVTRKKHESVGCAEGQVRATVSAGRPGSRS